MEIRPLTDDDVEEATLLAARSVGATFATPEKPYEDPTPEALVKRHIRVRHCLEHDADGAWVSVGEDGLTGVALSLRRGPLWHLSLLAVRADAQGQGIGRPLLEAAHRNAAGATGATILASVDPRALRRYHSLGFALEPAYAAHGVLDRSLLPADAGVREGSWERDADLVDELTRLQRGALRGADLTYWPAVDARLLVIDQGAERGVAFGPAGRTSSVAATSPAVAARLMTAMLATAEPVEESNASWITVRVPWAVDVAMALRLPLHLDGSLCTWGALGPLTSYLPSGVYG